MKTIAVISQKGGAGKTTLALHLAVCAELRKKKTIVVDLDPQRSSFEWGQKRASELPEVLASTPEKMAELQKKAAEIKTDLLIIDTAPHSNKSAAIAAQLADLVLIPCRASILDIRAIKSTIALLKLTNTPVFVVLNAVPASSGGQREEEAREALSKIATVAPAAIYNRVAYFDALIDGRAVTEYQPHSKATKEIKALYRWVIKQVE